jgi:hypothetical protein
MAGVERMEIMVTETRAENTVRFKGWMTAEEAADYLSVGRDYIYRLKGVYEAGGQGIPGFRLGDSGRALMFRIADLDAYKRSHPNLGKLRAMSAEDEEEPATTGQGS